MGLMELKLGFSITIIKLYKEAVLIDGGGGRGGAASLDNICSIMLHQVISSVGRSVGMT